MTFALETFKGYNSCMQSDLIGARGIFRSGSFFSPATSVVDAQDNIAVIVELPGLSVEDLDVKISENYVYLRGVKVVEAEEEQNNVEDEGREFGYFYKKISLPHAVLPEESCAFLDRGLLKILLSKCSNRLVS